MRRPVAANVYLRTIFMINAFITYLGCLNVLQQGALRPPLYTLLLTENIVTLYPELGIKYMLYTFYDRSVWTLTKSIISPAKQYEKKQSTVHLTIRFKSKSAHTMLLWTTLWYQYKRFSIVATFYLRTTYIILQYFLKL